MNKRTFIIVLCSSFLITFFLYYISTQRNSTPNVDKEILSYEECADLPGSIIQESLPPVCVTAQGIEIVQPITPEEEVELIENIDRSDWIKFENVLLGLSLDYPGNWGNPEVSSTSSRNQIKFENSFTITKGIYYTDERDRILTVNELINKNTPSRKIITDYQLAGVRTKRATYDHTSNARAELVVFPQEADGNILTIFFFYPKTDLETIREFFGVIATIKRLIDTPTTVQPLPSECIVTGCSSQICADEEVITTCEYREEYACYQSATCEKQASGECGWTMTDELKECLTNAQ